MEEITENLSEFPRYDVAETRFFSQELSETEFSISVMNLDENKRGYKSVGRFRVRLNK